MADATTPEVMPLSYSQRRQRTWMVQVLMLLAGTLLAAVIGAALPVGAILFSQNGYVIIGSGVGQGVLVGIVLAYTVRLTETRRPRFAGGLGVAAAILSVTLDWYGLYVREVVHAVTAGRGHVATEFFHFGALRAFRLYDQFILVPRFGVGGLRGFLLLKQQLSESTFGLIAGHVLLTGVVAFFIIREQTKRPWCPLCGAWTPKGKNAAVLPLRYFDPLKYAVQRGDKSAVLSVIRAEVAIPVEEEPQNAGGV